MSGFPVVHTVYRDPAGPVMRLLQIVRREGLFWIATVTSLLLLWGFLRTGQLNLLFAVTAVTVLLLAAVRSAATAALLTLGYLHVLGDLRRLADVATGIPPLDLLLLVAPIVVVVLALPLLFRLQVKDTLSKAMVFMTLLMTAEIFNPAQGGIAVGISGGLFYLVPVLWFWIGRRYATPQVVERLLYRVIFPLAVLAALLGLYQTLVGFFPYEQAWIDATLTSYLSLSLGGTTRAFGFSVSAAEYATLLDLAAAGVLAAWLGGRRLWGFAFPLLLGAMLMASARTVVLKLLFALAMAWTFKDRVALSTAAAFRLAFFLVIGFLGIGSIASVFAPDGSSSGGKQTATQESMAHLSGGLAHPLDSRYSTAGIHQMVFVNAMIDSFKMPFGHGIGATTVAAGKFQGENETYSSEVDWSDMFLTLGPAGGVLYCVIFAAAMRQAVLYTRVTAAAAGLPVLAILCATIASWLISGQYSTSALVFFLIGATANPEASSASMCSASMSSASAPKEQAPSCLSPSS